MNDPFALPPRLWFGVLCHGLGSDPAGQITLQSVFNQVQFFRPPAESGVPPHGMLNALLVVGFAEGLGHFNATVELRDIDDHVLWTREAGAWQMDFGPGQNNAAVLAERVQCWFTQSGRYHFRIRLTPSQEEHQIPFEVADQIGPARLAPGAPLGEPPAA